jgi:hypothetical protein
MLLLLLLAGCGGDTVDEPAPVINLNKDPRVEGRWQVTYMPSGHAQPQQATWRTHPICDVGPCTFSITSNAGARYSFEYDDPVKEWTGRDRQSQDCFSDKGNKLLVKDAYTVRSEITLAPVAVVKVRSESFVTEMTGERRDESSLSDEGFAKGCRDVDPTSGSIRAVRLDPPDGRPEVLGASEGGQPAS